MWERIVRQHDEKDCGPACLAMICAHFGYRAPLARFRDITGTDREGASIYGIVRAADQLGLAAEPMEGQIEEFLEDVAGGECPLPLIAHLITDENMEHFVVVFRLRGGEFVLGDPDKGRVRMSVEVFAQRWTGNIITFSRTERFAAKREDTDVSRILLALVLSQKKLLVRIFLLSLLITGAGVAGSFVYSAVVEQVTAGSGRTGAFLYGICLGVVGLYLLGALLQIARGRLLAWFIQRIDGDILMRYYAHTIRLPVSFFGRYRTGEILSRFTDAATIRDALSGAAVNLLLDTLMLLAGIVVMGILSVRLLVIALLFMGVYLLGVLLFGGPIKRVNEQVMAQNARTTSFFKESVEGVETIKSFRREEQVTEKTRLLLRDLTRSAGRAFRIYSGQSAVVDFLSSVSIVMILLAGANEVLSGRLSLGSLLTFTALFDYFLQPIQNLIDLQPTLQSASVAADRLGDILLVDTEPLYGDMERGREDVVFCGDIDIYGVSFRYGDNERTLQNVSLQIQAGETVAIVGESGSGKSTLAKLLVGFYEQEQGSIFFGETDSRQLTADAIRRHIAYVNQDSFFFADTVRNNLLTGCPNADEEKLHEVCRICCADSFIDELPLGYDTVLEENAHNLSGGQRQRLAVARALLKDPDILILDEASSQLDTVTERILRDAVAAYRPQMTCIVIAHRLAAIRGCDWIYVMECGEITQSGPHEKLLAQKGKYRSLWDEQFR